MNAIPTKWVEVGSVDKLFLYPLKSGRRIELEKADTTPVGFITVEEKGVKLRDRSFVVYEASINEFRNARTFPTLMKIECSTHDEEHVVFNAPDQCTLRIKIPVRCSSEVSFISLSGGEPTETLDCGDEAATWISGYLEQANFRIGYHDGEFKRDINNTRHQNRAYKNLNSESMGLYSNLCAFHLINQSSIERLNTELEQPITANYYRPNIVVKGNIPAFSEETWDFLKIGDAVFRNVRICIRCPITTINPETAEKSATREPLATLGRVNVLKDPVHIAAEGKAPVMGILLGLVQEGSVKVGDIVSISTNE